MTSGAAADHNRAVHPAALVLAVLFLSTSVMAQAQGLLVVSRGTAKVLEYDAGDGAFVAPFVEPITEGFTFPGGIAIHPSNGALHVASTTSGEIWVYDTPTGVVSPPTVANGLLAPGGLAFDPSGSSLYFLADVPNGPDTDAALRELELPGGSVSTLATDSVASFSALAVLGSDVYVSDAFGGEVLRYPISGGNGTTVVSGLSQPGGILFRSPTEMLIAETGADRVVEYVDGGSWTFDREVLSASAGVDGPFGLALAPDGRLSVSGSLSDDVTAVDLDTLAVSTLVAPGSAGLSIPGQLAWSGNTLLVASRIGNAVLYYDQNGTPTGTRARGLTSPADSGMTIAPGGSLFVASAADNAVVEYEGASGGEIRKLSNACPISFTQPFDVVVDASGGVYVSCPGIDGVRTFDHLGVAVPFVSAGSGGLSNPRGLAFGSNGNLFVASGDLFSRRVLEYDGATGAFVGVFVDETGNGGGSIDPYGLVFEQGSLFVASFANDDVRQFDATTGAFVQTFVTAGAGGLSGPRGLAFGPDGDLYVTSDGDDSVKRYDGIGGSFIETFVASGSGGLDQPFDLGFPAAPTVPSLPLWARLLLGAALAAVAPRRLPRTATAATDGASL